MYIKWLIELFIINLSIYYYIIIIIIMLLFIYNYIIFWVHSSKSNEDRLFSDGIRRSRR